LHELLFLLPRKGDLIIIFRIGRPIYRKVSLFGQEILFNSTHNNINPAEKGAIQELKERDDIVIKPADKGNAVVVMDNVDYLEEALELFNMPRTVGETDDFGIIKANYGRFAFWWKGL
jgi:topoisomerase IA-like protein